MLFSTNQVRQLYVVKKYNDVPTAAGDIAVKKTDDGKYMYFDYYGIGGPLRSDLIEIKNVMHTSFKTANDLALPLRKTTVKLDSSISDTPIVGEDYIVRIKFSSGSIDNATIKYGVVHAYKDMTAAKLYEAMKESLIKNFSRESVIPFEFSSDANGLYIQELEPEWKLGTYPQRPIEFEVFSGTISYSGMEVNWGNIETTKSGTYPNTKMMKDLEYFCMGERGDQYKNYNWPNVIPTEYMLEDKDTGYNVINIHYAFVDSNEAVQKSEKDITLVFNNSSFYNTITEKINEILNPTTGE